MNRNRALWIVQGLLAALFLFAGGMKLITPIAASGAGCLIATQRWPAGGVGLGHRPVIGHPHRFLLAGPWRHRAHHEAQWLRSSGPELEMHAGRDGQCTARLDVDDQLAAVLFAPDLPPAGGDIPDLFHRPVGDG